MPIIGKLYLDRFPLKKDLSMSKNDLRNINSIFKSKLNTTFKKFFKEAIICKFKIFKKRLITNFIF